MRFTIKLRVIILFSVFNIITLGVLSGVALVWYQAESYRNLDTYLETDAQGLVDSISSYLASELEGVSRSSVGRLATRSIRSADFKQTLANLSEQRRDKPQSFKTTSVIFDRNGASIFKSNSALPIEFPSPGTMDAFGKAQKFAESAIRTVGGPNRHLEYRLVSVPVVYRGQAVALVQEACLTSSIEGPIGVFRNLILVGLPMLWLLSGGAMVILLNRAFNPVTAIIQSIRKITGTELKVRVPVPEGEDEIQQLAITFNDMLDRVDLAFEFQTRLIQDLSHQLRTPLAVLKGTLETGLRRLRSAQEYEEILESNLEEVNRIGRLIESMLLLARLDSRSAPLERKNIDLVALISTLIDDLSPLWEQKSLHVVMDGPTELMISADGPRLRQAFLNLLDNSWKYSPVNSTINIKIANVLVVGERTKVEVRVTNQGPAIRKEDLDNIFERFYRARPNDSEKGASIPGFGLGLAIARAIVGTHGGSMRAENPPDGGVCFITLLPIA